jgi:hypothetical protein
MSNQSEPSHHQGTWAAPVDRLEVADIPVGALNLNVQGRQLSGLVRGFGQMWQKTYSIRLMNTGVTPQKLIQSWKDNFSSFWPKGNRFYTAKAGITPGDVALLNLAGPGGVNSPGGGPLISTGIMVIYSDDESFSFMTPEGHMFAGMITFRAQQEECILVQIQALIRASDPLYELMFRLGIGHKMEDDFWKQTLRNLAAYFHATSSEPELSVVVVDPRVRWKEAGNIWQNAAIRTGLYTTAAPFRWIGRKIKG